MVHMPSYLTCVTCIWSIALIASTINKRASIWSVNYSTALNLFRSGTQHSVSWSGTSKTITMVRVCICSCALLTASRPQSLGSILDGIATFRSLVVCCCWCLYIASVDWRLVSAIVAIKFTHLAFVVVQIVVRTCGVRFYYLRRDFSCTVLLNSW